MTCPNCGAHGVHTIRNVLVTTKQVNTDLKHCPSCDYLYLANPTWLDIAYQDEFYGDTGYVARNIDLAKKSLILFRNWKAISRQKSLPAACDAGAGLGMYARMMRDNGYEFYGSDEYAGMPLIKPFTSPKNAQFKIKTAFEVIEHLPSLPSFLREQIGAVDLFLFSTLLRRTGEIPDNEWWYYAFGNGQHISFHSPKSLAKAFVRAGYSEQCLLSHNSSLHAFAATKTWRQAFRSSRLLWTMQSGLSAGSRRLRALCFNESSFTFSDHVQAIAQLKHQSADPES